MRRRREQALSVFGGCKVLAAPELAIAKEDEEIEAKANGGKVVGPRTRRAITRARGTRGT